jgi:methylated-DNA-protein-cysteine methyltransferase-like protein
VKIYIKGEYMKKIMNEQLIYEILSVVEEIPEGKVATYGQIASLIGRDKNARLVGKVLSLAEYYGRYPCHRVVNHAGRLAPGWQEQRFLLLEEGVSFKDENHVDMKKNQWNS